MAFSANSKTQQHLGLLVLCGFGGALFFLLSVYKNICQMVIGPLMSCSPGGGSVGERNLSACHEYVLVWIKQWSTQAQSVHISRGLISMKLKQTQIIPANGEE